MSPRKPEHDCPCCTCGQVQLSWADRSPCVFLDDLEQVAEAVVCCALDHHYDRTDTGVPYGLPDAWTEALAKVVARHLDAGDPAWRDRTARVSHEALEAMRSAILSTLRTLSPGAA